ncbi:LuxR C-terminal-related transcriptional regulator [Achromobacter xylosoxidans]
MQLRSDLDSLLASLTPREREIVLYVATYGANKVIAIDLGISLRTVGPSRPHLRKTWRPQRHAAGVPAVRALARGSVAVAAASRPGRGLRWRFRFVRLRRCVRFLRFLFAPCPSGARASGRS